MGRTTTPVPTRERIIESALRLFSEGGTLGTSMRDLADAAGVTVPGLYYHFASKQDLVHAVFAARGLNRVLEPGADEAPPLPARLAPRIAEQGRREFARFTHEAEFMSLMAVESIRREPAATEVGNDLRDAWGHRWEEVLAGATDIDPKTDLPAAAACIRTFLWGLFVEYLTRRDGSLADRIDSFARLMSRSLARPARGAR